MKLFAFAAAALATPASAAKPILRPVAVAQDDRVQQSQSKHGEGAGGAGDVLVAWYKPHYQCGSTPGSTPAASAAFINAQLRAGDEGDDARDFVGVSEWAPTAPGVPAVGNPDRYGSVAAVCGYDGAYYRGKGWIDRIPVVLFHDRLRWDMLDSYPSSSNCLDAVFLPPWDAPGIPPACDGQVAPGPDDCCSCTFSEAEYALGSSWSENTGQRPWTAGIYRRKADGREVCVVAGEFPHPLANQTLYNLNGPPTWGAGPRPWSIQRYICTTQYNTKECVPNLGGTSNVFGTDVFVSGVAEFCSKGGQRRDVIVMADTNAGMGDFASSKLLTDSFYSDLKEGDPSAPGLLPHTCCNDTSYDGGMNRYASDRIMTIGRDIRVEVLEGGSTAPGGSLPDDLTYMCHSNEEHSPLRAYISLGP